MVGTDAAQAGIGGAVTTSYGPWMTWFEDHPTEHIEHKGRLVFHNTSGCVTWETEEGERGLWSGPGFDAFVSALIEAGEVAPGRILKLLQGTAMDALKAQLTEAVAVLREIEWVSRGPQMGRVCPSCSCPPSPYGGGHIPGCRLAKVLAVFPLTSALSTS